MVTALFVLMVFQGWETSTASGQGLFSRWRARIESRRQITPPQAPTRPQGLVQPPATQPDGRSSTSPQIPGQGRASTGSDDVPMFGIDVSPARVGAYQGLQVLGFRSDSEAARAGLRRGDVIVWIEGVRTGTLADVSLAQTRLKAGQRAEMQVIRGGKIYRVQVPVSVSSLGGNEDGDAIAKRDGGQDSTVPRIAAKPPVASNARPGSANGPTLARPRSSLGLEVRNATPKRGIEVVLVRESTAGEIGGLKPLDRIVSVEGRLVKDIDGLIRELALSQPGDEVQFGVVRGESVLELNIEMGGPGGKPIQSATQKRSETPPSDTPAPDRRDDGSDAGPSLLSGMGSALGGFFAGGDAKAEGDAKAIEETKREDGPQSGGFSGELMAPTQPNVVAESSADPLALPDDEPEFGKRSRTDMLPTPKPARSTDERSEVERLREEVKRLRAQLNQ